MLASTRIEESTDKREHQHSGHHHGQNVAAEKKREVSGNGDRESDEADEPQARGKFGVPEALIDLRTMKEYENGEAREQHESHDPHRRDAGEPREDLCHRIQTDDDASSEKH